MWSLQVIYPTSKEGMTIPCTATLDYDRFEWLAMLHLGKMQKKQNNLELAKRKCLTDIYDSGR